MITKEEFEEHLDEIMDNFDFEKVEKVMEFLDWKWAFIEGSPKVPTRADLRSGVRKQFREMFDKYEESKGKRQWRS